MAQFVSIDDIPTLTGRDLGVSGWRTIDQARIDAFASATDDHQFIHVDPEAAAQTPFGSTIAHGLLTLSLVVPMYYELAVYAEGHVMGLNYGLNKLRFINPVKVDSRIRLRARVADAVERSPGRFLLTHDIEVEIEGEDKPALVGQLLTMSVVGD